VARYILKRLLGSVMMLIGITVVTYLLLNLTPGDPADMYARPNGIPLTPQEVEAIHERLGLDKPIMVRYFYWIREVVRGNLGYSYRSTKPVSEEILSHLPVTLKLTTVSMLLSLFIGIFLGVHSALRQYRAFDNTVSVISFIGISVPSFWMAIMLVYLFGPVLHWLPTGGLRDVMLFNPTPWESFVDSVRHWVLPIFVLSFTDMAAWLRHQRASLLDNIHQDFVRTANGKGLRRRDVIWKHAFPNSVLPIITMLGLLLPELFSGAVIIENIFSIPGLGRLNVQSIQVRDYPVVMGTTLVTSVLVIVGILLADILYALLDPRIRFTGEKA